MHGGHSTGAYSIDGKQRQAEGRERWLRRLPAQGRKPGPPKGTGGRLRKTALVHPAELLRADTLAALGGDRPHRRSIPMSDAPEEGQWRFIEPAAPSVSNSDSPPPAVASPPPSLTLVHDADAIGQR